jgi:hypothetical protein
LIALIQSLGEAQLGPARRASRALQTDLDWGHIARRFLAAVVDSGAIKT